MAGIRALVGLAFSGAVGLTFLLLACGLPQYNNWWPMFVLMFYFASPVPMMIARKFADSMETSGVLVETMLFITSGIVISAYALPIVLARNPEVAVIQWGACGLIIASNTVVFGTIAAFFFFFRSDDYSMLIF